MVWGYEPDQKLKRKQFDKEEEKTILCFTKILEHWVGCNQREPFSLVADYEVFLISVILRAGYNEIESKL